MAASPRRVCVGKTSRRAATFALLLAPGSWLLASSPAPALGQPTQEEVFRSIQSNVGDGADAGPALGLAGGVLALLVLLAAVSHRRQRHVSPKPLDHPEKLLKEVLRTVPVKAAELKLLKAIVEEPRKDGGGGGIEHPLTLLLCPSALVKAAQQRPGRVDRRVVSNLVKKFGVR